MGELRHDDRRRHLHRQRHRARRRLAARALARRVLHAAEDPNTGRKLFGAKLIPNRGAWLEIETSAKDLLTVKIDRKRKVPLTVLLKALELPQLKGHRERP